MAKYSGEEVLDKIRKHREANGLSGNRFDLRESEITGGDLSGADLRNIDFFGSTFDGVDLRNADFDNCNLHKVWFKDCIMPGVKLTNSDVAEAMMRHMDLTGADFSGSNFHRALLEYTTLDGVKDDENTKFFRNYCPEEGPFVAWKCCTELRVVQLLVPADAKRCSATGETCRCSKAKVLSIKSVDETVSYDWAQSTVDPDFYYEVGKWVYPSYFQEDRWMDSSAGIHFFMTREEAVAYQMR